MGVRPLISLSEGWLLSGFWSAPRILEMFPGFWSCFQGFGVATRVLELLSGFWSCSQGFAVKCENLSDLFLKSSEKGTLKPEIEQRALLPLFYCLCLDISKGKIANFSASSMWRSFSSD